MPDVIGYGTRTGYVYTHIKVSRFSRGWIFVGPLCKQGVRTHTHLSKDAEYVRNWHVTHESLADIAAALPELAKPYTPCPKCLAIADREAS